MIEFWWLMSSTCSLATPRLRSRLTQERSSVPSAAWPPFITLTLRKHCMRRLFDRQHLSTTGEYQPVPSLNNYIVRPAGFTQMSASYDLSPSIFSDFRIISIFTIASPESKICQIPLIPSIPLICRMANITFNTCQWWWSWDQPASPVGALIPGESGQNTGVVQKLSRGPGFHTMSPIFTNFVFVFWYKSYSRGGGL